MSDINTVIISGRLTADPEIRYTPSGMAIGAFNLASDRKYKTQSGELRDETSFIGCTAFGKTAEFIGQYGYKGQPVIVQGRLKQDEWDDKDTGKKRSKTKVMVEQVKPMQWKDRGERQESAQQQREPLKPHETTPDINQMDDDNVPF